jgi:hypothetical protein
VSRNGGAVALAGILGQVTTLVKTIQRIKTGTWWPGTLAAMATWAWVPCAMANEVTKNGPSDAGRPVYQWIAAIVFAALCCAIAFKNPRRSHMD